MPSRYPVGDLHSDLLTYLHRKNGRTPFETASRSSHSQLKEGGVQLQALAIFTTNGPEAVQHCREQVQIFLQLPEKYPDHFEKFNPSTSFDSQDSQKLQVIAAFENSNGFCGHAESIEEGLKQLSYLRKLLKHILYIGLTWDGENRLGGGIGSSIGLKEDGQKLLEWMHDKSIAVDLSHTSDFLADDIFNYIDKKSLNVPIMASHSNARAITALPRNLPDAMAREIIRRGGIIGLNFFSPFSGNKDHRDIIRHVEHLYKLGGEKALCFGADFFCLEDFPGIKKKYNSEVGFYPECSNSSFYPYFLQLLQTELSLTPEQLKDLSHQNLKSYLKKTL